MMYCKKCGKELEDTAKFCDGCGEKQGVSSTSFHTESVNAVMSDGKQIIKKFFSKNPAAAITEAADSQSKTGVVLIAITALLFAFVSCFNTTQTINHMIKAAISGVNSTTNSLFGGALGNVVTGGAIPDVSVPKLFDLFFPFLLFALVVAAVVFATIYTLFKLKIAPGKSLYTIANVIGVSSLPITAALAVNFIIGFIFPQITIFVFLAAMLIGLVTLCEGFKVLFEADKAPIIEFSILIFALCVVLAIASQIAFAQVGAVVEETIMKAAGDGMRGLGELLGELLG